MKEVIEYTQSNFSTKHFKNVENLIKIFKAAFSFAFEQKKLGKDSVLHNCHPLGKADFTTTLSKFTHFCTPPFLHSAQMNQRDINTNKMYNMMFHEEIDYKKQKQLEQVIKNLDKIYSTNWGKSTAETVAKGIRGYDFRFKDIKVYDHVPEEGFPEQVEPCKQAYQNKEAINKYKKKRELK